MFDWLTSIVRPPGIHLPRRRSVFKALSAVSQVAADDAVRVLREWFPFTSSDSGLIAHGEVLGIPRFQSDTDEDYRLRVATAARYLDQQGRRSFAREYLDKVVPGRYRLTEYPKMGFRVGYSRLGYAPIGGGTRLFIRVRDITAVEQETIYDALDRSLDPDIEITVLEWVYLPVSAAGIDLIRKNGGGSWIASQLEDLADVSVELLPDDGFRVGYAPLGSARLVWTQDPVVMVRVSDPAELTAVSDRLSEVLDPAIERRVYSG